MRSYSSVIMFGIFTFLLMGCPPTVQKKIVKEPELKRVFYLPAEVITVEENLVTIRVEKPILFEEYVKLALQLAREIIENSYLLEGKERVGQILRQLETEVGYLLQAGIVFSKTAKLARKIQGIAPRHKEERERLDLLIAECESENIYNCLTSDEKKKVKLWKMMITLLE